ncbi:hypothetical protein NHH88_19435 [Oxalobacteraceae bacterium OTU3CAMAD1]|nr:hypothetical protein NHH88_19435 [Oxalobacteraceae bacterium OTU3CAMAD1]
MTGIDVICFGDKPSMDVALEFLDQSARIEGAQLGHRQVIGEKDAADLARFLSADPWPSPVKLRIRI